jgi:hypothetical protein
MFKPSPKMSCSSANDIPEVDPDAEFDPLLRRGVHVALGHPPLHLNCATHRVNDALEFDQHPVAGVLYNPAAILGLTSSRRCPFSRSSPPHPRPWAASSLPRRRLGSR